MNDLDDMDNNDDDDDSNDDEVKPWQMAKEKELQHKQEEYYDTLAQAAEMAKREKDEAEYMNKKNAELRAVLKQQIVENESKRRNKEQEKFKEGKEIKMKMVSLTQFCVLLDFTHLLTRITKPF